MYVRTITFSKKLTCGWQICKLSAVRLSVKLLLLSTTIIQHSRFCRFFRKIIFIFFFFLYIAEMLIVSLTYCNWKWFPLRWQSQTQLVDVFVSATSIDQIIGQKRIRFPVLKTTKSLKINSNYTNDTAIPVCKFQW